MRNNTGEIDFNVPLPKTVLEPESNHEKPAKSAAEIMLKLEKDLNYKNDDEP